MADIRLRVIKPKNDIDRSLVDDSSAYIGKRIADLLRSQAKATVRSWENSPSIKIKTKRRTQGDDIQVEMHMEGWAVPIWDRLDKGTEAHTITPKNARFLVFRQDGFVAKTKPGRFASNPGSKATGDLQFRKKVKHPGTAPRGWSDEMLKRSNKKLKQLIRDAQRKASAKLK